MPFRASILWQNQQPAKNTKTKALRNPLFSNTSVPACRISMCVPHRPDFHIAPKMFILISRLGLKRPHPYPYRENPYMPGRRFSLILKDSLATGPTRHTVYPPSPNIAMRVWYHFRSVSGIIVRFVLYFITYGVYDRYRSHGSSRSLYSHSSLISFIPGFVASSPSKNNRIIRAFDMSSITTSCSPEIYAFSPSCILYAERATIGCAVWLSNLSTYTS